jgi:hypothetical protein
MTAKPDTPIYTPDNEPYLGRESLWRFDEVIVTAMDVNGRIGPWTHGRELSPLQRAGAELLPHGFSIALSIRELIRQGYLISAEILLRPLIERAAVVSYLCETLDALALWESGWPHKSRPPLYKMLATMRGQGNTRDDEDIAKQITDHFNSIIHADPIGARTQAITTSNGRPGYTSSKTLRDVEKCDEICIQATMYLIILLARATQIFPEATYQRT